MFYFQISNNQGIILSEMMAISAIEYLRSDDIYKLIVKIPLNKNQYENIVNIINDEIVFNLFLYDYQTNQASVIENCYLNSFGVDYDIHQLLYNVNLAWIHYEVKSKPKVNWKNGF